MKILPVKATLLTNRKSILRAKVITNRSWKPSLRSKLY
jgi:hypothetical protein